MVLIPKTHTILSSLKISEGCSLCVTKFMNTCSCTIHFKIINVCYKVLVISLYMHAHACWWIVPILSRNSALLNSILVNNVGMNNASYNTQFLHTYNFIKYLSHTNNFSDRKSLFKPPNQLLELMLWSLHSIKHKVIMLPSCYSRDSKGPSLTWDSSTCPIVILSKFVRGSYMSS